MADYVPAAILGGFWLWHYYDAKLTNRYAQQYKPIHLPEHPSYSPGDVSLVVPTIDTDDEFASCLQLWLQNKPREIIIVTIERDYEQVRNTVSQVPGAIDKVSIRISERANIRHQLSVGIAEANGSVIALADDDAYWSTPTVLPYLLAGLENEAVGATFGMQNAYIPSSNQDASTATFWEVAALRSMSGQSRVHAVRYAADGGCWCLSGGTILIRAAIVRDQTFLHEFKNEMWYGKALNSGDDAFITRYLINHGWEMRVQNAPEAEVKIHVHADSKFASQLLRWQRTTVRSFLKLILHKPGFWALRRRHPYMARKLVERLLRPVLSLAYLASWVATLRVQPYFAYLVGAWYVYTLFKSHCTFYLEYPWVRGIRGNKVYALLFADHWYLFLDWYALFTLHRDSWMTRRDETTPNLTQMQTI